jgi:hypothetical protein
MLTLFLALLIGPASAQFAIFQVKGGPPASTTLTQLAIGAGGWLRGGDAIRRGRDANPRRQSPQCGAFPLPAPADQTERSEPYGGWCGVRCAGEINAPTSIIMIIGCEGRTGGS